jgi:sugar phosphate isomerase/epimerase
LIRSAVTISLVPEARGGPFIFWEDLEAGCRKAKKLGFDAVEVFPPGPEAIASPEFKRVLAAHDLRLAAVGTGGGWVRHRLTLTDPDGTVRSRAREFIKSLVDVAGALGAPAIVGSMQGRWGESVDRDTALRYLKESLYDLGKESLAHGVPLLYEPLNRYETNLVNTLADGSALLDALPRGNVKLLADLFHMNIEEADIASAITAAGARIGHVHVADSNRRPAGGGHTDFAPAVAALRGIGYAGYASVEALPLPDSDAAAQAAIESHRLLFG